MLRAVLNDKVGSMAVHLQLVYKHLDLGACCAAGQLIELEYILKTVHSLLGNALCSNKQLVESILKYLCALLLVVVALVCTLVDISVQVVQYPVLYLLV